MRNVAWILGLVAPMALGCAGDPFSATELGLGEAGAAGAPTPGAGAAGGSLAGGEGGEGGLGSGGVGAGGAPVGGAAAGGGGAMTGGAGGALGGAGGAPLGGSGGAGGGGADGGAGGAGGVGGTGGVGGAPPVDRGGVWEVKLVGVSDNTLDYTLVGAEYCLVIDEPGSPTPLCFTFEGTVMHAARAPADSWTIETGGVSIVVTVPGKPPEPPCIVRPIWQAENGAYAPTSSFYCSERKWRVEVVPW